MIVLKIDETEKGLAIVLTAEAQELLAAKAGQAIGLQVAENGDVTISVRDMSFEARRERGRAFLKRYDKTFQSLAK